jgi:serine/threonine-protein kinase HipA
MTSERSCYVYIVLPDETEFVTAGRFQLSSTRDGLPVGKFIYGKTYLARSNAVELDPLDLKLNTSSYTTARLNGFFGVIRDAMPDYWGRSVIQRNAGRQLLVEFDYLMEGPDDRAGALGFGLNTQPPAPCRGFNKTLHLAHLQKIAEQILYGDSDDDHQTTRQVQELLLQGTSMGGARPKATIEDNDCLWIAKFGSPHDRWNQPLVEHAFLKLARECGLHVAESKLCTVSGKDVLLVQRFDRHKTTRGYQRHRMVSALTLLQSEESPVERERWSYLLLADELRRCSTSPQADLHELFARMCFNAIVSNADDHPRNHAILAKNHHWRLSPAYDLTPTPSIAHDTRYLAMTCGTYGRLASYENLLSMSERFLLSKPTAKILLDNMIEVVKKRWEPCLLRAGGAEKDCRAIASSFLYDGFYYHIVE